ncbi:MAG: hypothetical protein HW386_2287 [Gammaproteobacteria bacterium]|nr:hypothetical protein [Gammaproteobacteria bacterium]
MQEAILLMDIGGTHTRARLVRAREEMLSANSILAEHGADIADKQTLLAFIRTLLTQSGCVVTAAVLSFAGPVKTAAVTMTNWPRQDAINIAELVALGLPATQTDIINDMEAAALCLIAYKTGRVQLEVHELYTPAGGCQQHFNNAILIIPGTGVGVAGIVMANGAAPAHVSCELQHTAAAGFDDAYADLLARLRHQLHKDHLSWEDLVSGQGLENIYQALLYPNSGDQTHLTAAAIASRAVAGTDKTCREALACYYHAAGALTQVVALAFQPFAGIYLGGETTTKNMAFIRHSSFVAKLQDNNQRRDLLQSFPVYLLPAYLNLTGAQYLACRNYQ